MRSAACQEAERWSAVAVRLLVEIMATAEANVEVARAAKRALWRIVHRSGRPRNARGRRAVAAGLLAALASGPIPVRRELLWMLGEIGDGRAVVAIAPLLGNLELREEARCALQRIPGRQATNALKAARATETTQFKRALDAALRGRGPRD
jgi:HEAT repeat protein